MTKISIGAVISRSFAIWSENLVRFTLLIAAAFCVPAFVFSIIIDSIGSMGSAGIASLESVAPVIAIAVVAAALSMLLLYNLASAAMIYSAFEHLRGRRPSMGTCISVSLGRLVSLLYVSVLSAICIGFGYMLLIIPGIVILCMLFVVIPVALIENIGGGKALERSNELTKGYKGTIFGIIVVLGLISFGMSVIHDLFVAALPDIVGTIVAFGGSAFFMALSSVTVAVVYHDLRLIKDGAGTEVMARGFE